MGLYKFLEIFFAMVSILGFFLKTQGITGSDILIISGGGLLALYYMLHSISPTFYEKTSTSQSFLPRLTYAIFTTLVVGIVMKWLLWKSADKLLGFTLLSAFVALVLILFNLKMLKNNAISQFYRKLLARLLFIAAVALMFYQTSLSKLKKTYDRPKVQKEINSRLKK